MHSRQEAIGAATVALLVLGLAGGGCKRTNDGTAAYAKPPDFEKRFKRFAAEKATQARNAAHASGQKLLPEYETLFAAASKPDWPTVRNTFDNLASRAPQYQHSGPSDDRLTGTQWQAVLETFGGLEALTYGGEKYCTAFGRDIIDSIPSGSVFFGGTDPGRFIVTTMCNSHVNADPLFTLSQNPLADAGYLAYLRATYGSRIQIPNDDAMQACYQQYVDDARRRQQRNQLKPGEHVEIVDGKPRVTGIVAVMGVNGLLAKWIVDHNPDRDFYIEESWPLEWMYPLVEPHHLIFRINRTPLASLSEAVTQKDRAYWTHYIEPMIGSWLKFETPLREVGSYVDKVYFKRDRDGFKGDPEFLENLYAQRSFSKLRGNIANAYLWRLEHASSAGEKSRMAGEADFALRQAWALCPDSDEIVMRYVKFLAAEGRVRDAVLVGETAARLPGLQIGRGAQLRDLIRDLKSRQPL